MTRIRVSGPWITEKEIAYVADAVANAWYANANVYHDRFEKAFADYAGVRYAMALPSCTSAIHLALAALNIGPGDEVIVPEATWIASAAPITYVGATPVFADIDEKTWCLDPESFEQAITPRTRAVIPVDLYGGPADFDAITAIADRHGVAIIEDAAEAIGTEYGGRRAGSFGRAGVFSFHGSKTLTTGEGGMLVTNDERLYQRAGVLRDHGRAPGDTMFFNREVAYKYKMSSMQAALGMAQLERVDELVARKREIFEWYRAHLAGRTELSLNHERPGTKNAYWMITVIVDPELGVRKEEISERLSAAEIDTRPFFHPLSSIPAYAGSPSAAGANVRNPIAYRIAPHGVNLPSGLTLTKADVARVCEVLLEAVDAVRAPSPPLSRTQ